MAHMTKNAPVLFMSNEDALEIAQDMTELTINHLEGVTVYTGKHQKHGSCHVIVPAFGGSMLLFSF